MSSSVLTQAEKHHWGADAQAEANNTTSDPNDSDDDDSVNEEKSEKGQLKQREVFLSRQTENLPATLIRGKCAVTLLSEVENAQSYLGRDDAFFYALVYDPHAKTLVADRGEIRIGSNYQVIFLNEIVKQKYLVKLTWFHNIQLMTGSDRRFFVVSYIFYLFCRQLFQVY